MSTIRQERLRRLVEAGLYLVTDERLPPLELERRLKLALAAGVGVVQFRYKDQLKMLALRAASRVGGLSRQAKALFLVNDYPQLAVELDADGVHVGQDDVPASVARQIVGSERLVGVSISSVPEAARAAGLDIDYLGVGSIYATPTKPDAEYGGLELLRQVRRAVDLPLFAIGGITLERVPEVMEAGADGVAVVSAVFSADQPRSATRALLEAIRKHRAPDRRASP